LERTRHMSLPCCCFWMPSWLFLFPRLFFFSPSRWLLVCALSFSFLCCTVELMDTWMVVLHCHRIGEPRIPLLWDTTLPSVWNEREPMRSQCGANAEPIWLPAILARRVTVAWPLRNLSWRAFQTMRSDCWQSSTRGILYAPCMRAADEALIDIVELCLDSVVEINEENYCSSRK
jgi:hypothetical protein